MRDLMIQFNRLDFLTRVAVAGCLLALIAIAGGLIGGSYSTFVVEEPPTLPTPSDLVKFDPMLESGMRDRTTRGTYERSLDRKSTETSLDKEKSAVTDVLPQYSVTSEDRLDEFHDVNGKPKFIPD